jgi:transcriptional regulator with XRE-family HTH domain
MTPGMRILARRNELGLKQGALAKLAGISQSSLCELEKGESKMPSAKALHGLAKALNVTPAWIITGKDGEIEQITQQEADLVQAVRGLTVEQQQAVYNVVRSMTQRE